MRSVRRSPRVLSVAAVATLTAVLAACGGDGNTSPNTPRTVTLVSADSQRTQVGVAMTAPLVVEVTGGSGSPLSGVPVTWSVGFGGGSFSDTTVTTDAEGHASTVYTPGTTPGAARVTATAGGASATFALTLTAGPPATLGKLGFDNPAVVSGSTLALRVHLADSYGNAVEGATINWSATGGTLSGETSTSNDAGVASISLTVSEPGTYTLTASFGDLDPVSFTVTAIRPPPES